MDARTGDERERSGGCGTNFAEGPRGDEHMAERDSLEKLGKLADDYVLAQKSEAERPRKPSPSVRQGCDRVDVRKLTVGVIGSVTYAGSGGI